MRFPKVKLLATTLFCLAALICLPLNGQAYYGSGYGGGLYGSSLYGGLYGGYGMYGGGLYGSSMYGGGLYGGLYGSSMYGGLYGGYGMYGGGLYGSSMYGGLYGGYGMYGGGLYGSSMYGGLGLYGGLYGGLGTGLGMYGRYPFEAGSTPLVEPTRTPAALTTLSGGGGVTPAGIWSGTYLSYISLKGGICNMNLLYNSLTRTVTGTAGLLLNKLIPLPINVSGLYLGSPFTLSGSYFDLTSLVTYYEDLTCTLVSASFMTGTYLIHDALYLKSDAGEFNVSKTLVPVI